MKKTDEYYQALEVCNNAKDYHNMDVMVARTYVRAYDEAINYSQCCTELKREKCNMCNEEKDCQGHAVCEDCGGRSF